MPTVADELAVKSSAGDRASRPVDAVARSPPVMAGECSYPPRLRRGAFHVAGIGEAA